MSRSSPDLFEPGDAQRLRRRVGWIGVSGAFWLTLPTVVVVGVALAGVREHWPWGLVAVLLIVPGVLLYSLGDGRRNMVVAPYADAAQRSRAWWWGLWLTGLSIPTSPPPRLDDLETDVVVGRVAVLRWPLWVASAGFAAATAWLSVALVTGRLEDIGALGWLACAACGWVATVRLLAGPRPGRVVLEADADELWIGAGTLEDTAGRRASRLGAFGIRWARVRRVTLSRASGGRLLLGVETVTEQTYTADLTHVWLDVAALEACVLVHTGRPPAALTP